MATDYDAPRRRMDDEIETDSLEGLKAAEVAGSSMDDDGEIVEPVEPPFVICVPGSGYPAPAIRLRCRARRPPAHPLDSWRR